MERRHDLLIPPLSLCLGATLLSGAWLQPNHFFPWPSFHSEAWAAITLLITALVIVLRSRGAIEWPSLALMFFAVSLIPLAQFAAGQLATSGEALLACAYLAGVGLAILIGARWERVNPANAADGLFLAIGVAAIGSVAFQLHQWTQSDALPILSMGSTGARPAANVGQANLLGTLLLWGIVAGAWACWRGQLRPVLFLFYAGFLLLGVALTDSRAAVLNAGLLTMAAWVWRGTWPWRRAPWVATALLMLLAVYVLILPYGLGLLFQTAAAELRIVSPATGSIRLTAYTVLLDAVAQRPWLGYGWEQTAMAQMAVAPEHPPLGVILGHAHNLVIDLLVWCGIPVACAIVFSLVIWSTKAVTRVREPGALLLLMPLTVFVVHSMLEYPFAYGFILWPAGLFAGMLSTRLGMTSSARGSGAWLLLPCVALLGFAFVAVRDGYAAEENYRSWRFEVARVGKLPPAQPPPMKILTQLDAALWSLRATEMRDGVSEAELAAYRQAYALMPSALSALHHAKALALAGKKEEARQWQAAVNHVFEKNLAALMRDEWTLQSKTRPEMARVPWPAP